MKILKIIGLLILIVIVSILVAGAFMKKDFHFEGTTTINAPSDVVWNNVVMFENHKKWSQWKEMDPNMKVEITGEDGKPGAKMSWKSDHKKVGNGSQTITAVDPGKRVDTDLDFGGKGQAKAYMIVEGDSVSAKATWGMDMKAPYPMNAIMGLFMGDHMMDEMFEKGLGMLKAVSEKEK